jgi:hypothetical protein
MDLRRERHSRQNPPIDANRIAAGSDGAENGHSHKNPFQAVFLHRCDYDSRNEKLPNLIDRFG